jgi:beta-lactamase superfamily II metal-dependent hydrolase
VAARPTSTDDLVRKLEALAVRATDVRSRQPAEALDKLVAMRGEFRALRQAAREFGHASEPGVQRAVGAAARQLGLFGSAAAAYRAVIERPGAEHGRDLEQLANVEARFAQRKAFGSGLDVDTDIDDQSLLDAEPEALFQLAEDRLRIALGIAKSEERYGLLGSLYKKWATVDRERRDELLRKAFDAYAMAAELPGSRGYGLENARHLAALLGESDPTPSSSATGPVATLPRVLLIDERPTTADYWGLAGAGDRWITELLRSGEPAAGVRDAAVRADRQAFETRSSASERDSVLTHLRDLARLAPSDSSCKRELAAILVALDDWDPWAQPGPSADATAAEAGPSRSVSRAGDLVVSMFPAGPGDSLVLEWGPPSARVSMLIDGGLSLSDDSKLVRHLTSRHTPPFVDILVVSHVDGDHVKGAIDAVHERGLTYGDVWFNGTNQLVTDRSIAQGCRFDSLTLGENRNPMFGGKAIAVPPQGPLPTVTLAHGATVTFVSPDGQRLDRLASAWRRALDKSRTRGGAGESDELDAFLQELGDDDVAADRGTAEGSPNWGADTSVPNGSSIAFLFEYDGAALLFTGDAYAGVMEQSIARLLVERGVNRLRLDAFKVSHHGSAYNLTPQLLDLVECDRFLISTDGSRHGHPDPPVVELILGKFPEASIIVNHDNPDIRARVGHSTNIVYPDGRSYAVFG